MHTTKQIISLHRPRWPIHDGTIEALKWLALLSMVLDHVNAIILYPLELYQPWLFSIGRLAAPLFAVILGYNLARPGNRLQRTRRFMRYCGPFAILSMPAYYLALPAHGFSLNILFDFWLGALVIYLFRLTQEAGHTRLINWLLQALALTLYIVLAGWVEYGHAATGCMIASFLLFTSQQQSMRLAATLALLAAIFGLGLLNGQHTALLAFIPLLLSLCLDVRWRYRTPRLFFYWFYPLHQAVLAIVARTLLLA